MPGITTTTITEPTPEKDTPAVLAYRVGQLEKAVTDGLATLGQKIDDLRQQFTPLSDHIELKDRVSKIESKNGLKQTLLWVGLVASAIINIVMVAKLFGA